MHFQCIIDTRNRNLSIYVYFLSVFIKCVLQVQFIDETKRDLMSDNEVDEHAALTFEGSATVGTLFDSEITTNAAAYWSGVVARKLNRFHYKKFKSTLNECNICCNILEPQNLTFHTFTTFKEYSMENSLLYPSKKFIDNIIILERIILYFLANFVTKFGFVSCLRKYVVKHFDKDFFCCKELEIKCINFIVKSRCFHAEKRINKEIEKRAYREKVRKIKHK